MNETFNERYMSDSSACMVTPLLPLTYTQTNHVGSLHTSLYVAFWQVTL